MRISDCSSDVCSSDLRRTFALPKRDGASRGSGPIQASWSKLKMSLVPARTVARRASKRPHRLRCLSNSAAIDRDGWLSRTLPPTVPPYRPRLPMPHSDCNQFPHTTRTLRRNVPPTHRKLSDGGQSSSDKHTRYIQSIGKQNTQ